MPPARHRSGPRWRRWRRPTQSPTPEKSPAARAAPAAMVEWQPNAEETDGLRQVGPELMDVDPGSVGEEHEGERHLSQGTDGRRVQVEVDERGRAVGDHEAENDEGNRCRNVPALETCRDETPQDNTGRDDGKGCKVEVVCHGSRRRTSKSPGWCRIQRPLAYPGRCTQRQVALRCAGTARERTSWSSNAEAEGELCDRHR